MYEGYISHSVAVPYLEMPHIRYVYVLFPLVRPYVRHLCVLLPLVMPHAKHAHLGLYMAVSLRVEQITFGFGFPCATAMGCAGIRLLSGIIIFL